MKGIELFGVTLRIDGRTILDEIGFTVAPGESVALTGPNGSGKTSVLRCLLGLAPFEGRGAIGGHDVLLQPLAARSMVGYLPQRPSFGDSSALELLIFTARLRRVGGDRVTQALDRFGLREHASARARTLSGGLQQRLSLAVALLAEPPVLLLDEPTAGLDRQGQSEFFELVRELRRQGRTLLLSSHRPEEAARLTDRVLELERGRLSTESRELPEPQAPQGPGGAP